MEGLDRRVQGLAHLWLEELLEAGAVEALHTRGSGDLRGHF